MGLVILDRDGVINYDSDEYIKSLEEWVPIPGSLEAIAQLNREGYAVVVVTNQSGVGRGLLDMEGLERIHTHMLNAVQAEGGEIDGIFICPHKPEDHCECRKPSPGLFFEVSELLKIDLDGVYAVGDSERDILAARRAKALPILVRTGKGEYTLRQSRELVGVPVFDNLAAFVSALLSGRLEVH